MATCVLQKFSGRHASRSLPDSPGSHPDLVAAIVEGQPCAHPWPWCSSRVAADGHSMMACLGVCHGDWEMRGSGPGNPATGPDSVKPQGSQESSYPPCNRYEASNQGSQQPAGPSSTPGDVEGKTLKSASGHREVLCATSGLMRGHPAFTRGAFTRES